MLAVNDLQDTTWILSREDTRRIVYQLGAMGVNLALKNGRIAAKPGIALVSDSEEGGRIVSQELTSIPEEARGLLREYREALLVYLTTPPEDDRPCAACGRPIQWTLDPVGVWVCDCYYHPELHTWPDIDHSQFSQQKTGPDPQTVTGQLLADSDQAAAVGSQIRSLPPVIRGAVTLKSEEQTGHTGQSTLKTSALPLRASLEKHNALSTLKTSESDLSDVPAEEDMIAIGVLADDGLHTWTPGQQKTEHYQASFTELDIETMYRLACQYRLHSLWLCPGSAWSLHYFEHPEDFAPTALSERYRISVKRRDPDKVPCSGTICSKSGPRGHRPMLHIFLPDHDSTWLEDLDDMDNSWSFSDIEEPGLFLGTLVLIYQKLRVYLSTSPAKTGIESMQLYTRASEWTHTPEELALPHFAERDLQWKRALADSEQGLYLHRFDRNSMYLAATTGADMGKGIPEHREKEEAVRAFSEGAMGIWEVTIAAPDVFSQETRHFPHNDTWTGKQWLTSPGVKALVNLGYTYEIHQGYVWFNEKGRADIGKRRALKEWASDLFHVRQELKTKYGKDHPAYKLIKMIANRSLGWLDLTSVHMRIKDGCEVKDVPWYYKPYYYQEIKGLARLRMTVKLQELVQDSQELAETLALVFTDCFGLLSTEPDARRAFPKLLERENELGGFKYVSTLKVTPEVIEAFSPGHAANETLKRLKAIEREAA